MTPVVKGFKFLVAVLAAISVQQLPQLGLKRALVGLVIALAVGFVVAYVTWRFTGYRIVDRELHIETGVVFRRSRRVPLERLQAVDIVRPLLGRALGLSELRLEVVGRGRTEAPLAYLTEVQAHELRARLLALAAGVDEQAPEPPETLLAAVPTADLVRSILLQWEIVLGVPLLVIATAGAGSLGASTFFATAGVLLAAGLVIWQSTVRRLLVEYGFTVAQAPDGLRLRHGLLETRAQTVPPGRTQAVRIIQPLLWRRRDWVRVEVDVAGYGGGDEQGRATRALLPVAPRTVALAVLANIIAHVDVGSLPLLGVPRRARRRAPVQWARLGVAATPTVVAARRGRISRILDLVPPAKIQSVRLTQGPWQRALRLASVHVDSAGRHVTARALHRDAREAGALVESIAELARAERERRRR